MSFVTKPAMSFVQSAVLPNGDIDEHFSWEEYTQGHDAVLFFYPLDFTFVCPSELIALHHRMDAFRERKTKVVAISIDSVYTHAAWRNTPHNLGGIGMVDFPLVADLDHSICKYYHIEHSEACVALRATIIVDKTGMVRAQHTHDLPIGRNIDEIIRVIDAIQFHREHGEVCPAGWQKGKDGMHANADGVKNFLKHHAHDL